MKLMLAEDEPGLSRALTVILQHSDYEVDTALDGLTALEYLLANDYDAAILDIMMPGMNGIEVLKRTRAAGKRLPIIMLTAKSEVSDKVEGLDAGANDYLTKPFSVEELLARIRTTLRRLSYAQIGMGASEGSFDAGELHIDFDAGIATMDGEELHLTPIEYKLLCLLAHNADKVLTHQFILHEIWGTATKSDLASLRVFMGTLRKKIESDPAHPRYIQTHVGIGYRLVTQG